MTNIRSRMKTIDLAIIARVIKDDDTLFCEGDEIHLICVYRRGIAALSADNCYNISGRLSLSPTV